MTLRLTPSFKSCARSVAVVAGRPIVTALYVTASFAELALTVAASLGIVIVLYWLADVLG